MKQVLSLLSLLLLCPALGFAQSFDWLQGDKTPGNGKFIFGTFTKARNGNINGTGIMYRHANRAGTKSGRILISGNELTRQFTSTVWENNLPERYQNTVSLRSRTTKTYRITFRHDGATIEMGAIQK